MSETTACRALVVEDHDTLREAMIEILEEEGCEVRGTSSGDEALSLLADGRFDLVVADYRLPGADGMAVLRRSKEVHVDTEVMIITAYGTIQLAVEAMKEGALDFLTKPFSHEEFRVKTRRALERLRERREMSRMAEENVYLRNELEVAESFGDLVGVSQAMRDIFRLVDKVAKSDSTVIVYGESGTGKELVARAIHRMGPRRDRPFIRVNCGALAEGVLESELFGHEKGAFTGAVRRKKGRFELAHTGSIFLDEIAELSPATQVKLLRVLQEKEFERVGGEETIRADVRVIAATNCDLRRAVNEGKFREDLYFRLHVLPIHLPPLRQRKEDIRPLAKYLLDRIGERLGRAGLQLSQRAFAALEAYEWPGNVRELENVLERAAVLSDKQKLTAGDMPLLVSARREEPALAESFPMDLVGTVEKLERALIEQALQRADGVKSRAARLLGLKTTALYYKMDKYGLRQTS